MSGRKKSKDSPCTWDDYQSWHDDQRWEIIEGEAYAMTPSPLERHQRILADLMIELHGFFKTKNCRVYPAPMDLKLSDQDVVQPDILVVCDPSQIRKTHIEGPPSLVIEILSPATTLHDRGRKLELYARSGVQEVWLVTPYPSAVEVFLLDGESYRLKRTYAKEDTLQSPCFPGLEMELGAIFNFPVDPDEQIQLIKEGRPPAYAPARQG